MSEENAIKRDQYVDIMRGIAMMLVVLGHTMTGCTKGAENSFLYNIGWSLQIPLFILVSGYVNRYSRKIYNVSGLLKYIKRRTIAYLLPWAVWSFIVRGILFRQTNFLNIRWILWHMDSGYWFLATIWTISMVFGISILISQKVAQKSELMRQFIALMLYIIGMCLLAGIGMIVGWSFFSIKLTIYYMPFYYVGYLYGQYRDRILSNRTGEIIVDVAVAVSLAVWIFIMMRYHLYQLSDSGLSIMLRVVCSLTGCIAVCGLCKGLFNNPSLKSWGGVQQKSVCRQPAFI